MKRKKATGRYKIRRIIYLVAIYFCVIILLTYVLFPFIWMLSSSLKPESEIRSVNPTFIPKRPTLQHFTSVLRDSSFIIYFRNSLVIGAIVTFISMFIACLGAYSLSRMAKARGLSLITTILLASQMIPGVLLIMPLYVMMMHARFLNTYAAPIIAYLTFGVPVSAWMLKGYFDNIPIEIEESAMVDGCNKVSALFMVILPVAWPGLVAASLSCFVFSWIEFLYAFTFIDNPKILTLPPGLALYQGIWVINWGGLMAASVLATVPVAISFSYFQKYMVQGLTAGAIKG